MLYLVTVNIGYDCSEDYYFNFDSEPSRRRVWARLVEIEAFGNTDNFIVVKYRKMSDDNVKLNFGEWDEIRRDAK